MPQSKPDPDFIPDNSPDFIPDEPGTAAAAKPSIFSQVGTGLKNLGIGAAKGLGSTVSSADDFARQHLPAFMTNTGFGFGKPEDIPAVKNSLKPEGTMQALGKGAEQAAEFLIPGAAEEKAVSAVPEIARPLARIGTSALSSGIVNKAQGGGFGAGAAAGGIGAGIGQAASKIAPQIAESAIGIRKGDRAFGKTPGQAILDETKGIRPETVASSAQGRISSLTPELENAAAASPRMANLQPARDVVSGAITKATGRNAAGTVGQLRPMDTFLNQRFDTGAAIPSQVHPSELLNLKRGFNDEFGHWNPETLPGVSGTGRSAYHALDQELDRTVPEAQGINQRISSLIPVAKRAESADRAAPIAQKLVGRAAAHTGALTMGGLGAVEGRREGGLPGAILGGVTGLVAPELVATPEGQMITARTLASEGGRTAGKLLQGAALQANRKKDDEQ